MTAKTSRKERGSNSGQRHGATEAAMNMWKVRKAALKEAHAAEQSFREKEPDQHVTPFEPTKFGGCVQEISDSHFRHSVVSISLLAGDTIVFSCSGTAVRHWNNIIQEPHTVFVTTSRLVVEFENKRTRDDNFVVQVCRPDGTTIPGFLGLWDEKMEIAIVTAFNSRLVYPVDTCGPLDLHRDADKLNLFAAGRHFDGTLMSIRCNDPRFKDGLWFCECSITEAGLGGPVILFNGGEGCFAGVITKLCQGGFLFVPTQLLHERLQQFEMPSNTTQFREYSLPQGASCVVPSGFKVRSKMLESLGYPLPPPLVFESNGRLIGTFEERFGELHVWKGYRLDIYANYEKPLWKQLGKKVVERVSKSVVSVASFNGNNVRCFACTGLLITIEHRMFVLTAASLVRTGDAKNNIDLNLMIKVFLPPEQSVVGKLEFYHQDYNIAVLSLEDNLTDVCPQDIFVATRLSKSEVVAIGRTTKDNGGLLMASKGNRKSIISSRNKDSGSELDCKDLKFSTCQIKKVGIGGPLICLDDGSFVGMNFYDESGTTPYLPRSNIVKVLKRGNNLLSQGKLLPPISLDTKRGGNAAERIRWTVPKPYWFIAGQVDVLGHLVGKVPM
ncbi:uncharacterized protein LOC119363397 [Triticum dicoccoides]|uniref:uncharacterized protein LOC119363397 n=1 Tax=Triticum dicoccoides TaxID=85692 RepID=UPI00188DD4B8|nr:uncharacterized protein LOC119363397 [Triticum dicoccoides]